MNRPERLAYTTVMLLCNIRLRSARRRSRLAAGFAVLLLLAQWAGMVHGLDLAGHADETSCAICLASGTIGDALTVAPARIPATVGAAFLAGAESHAPGPRIADGASQPRAPPATAR